MFSHVQRKDEHKSNSDYFLEEDDSDYFLEEVVAKAVEQIMKELQKYPGPQMINTGRGARKNQKI